MHKCAAVDSPARLCWQAIKEGKPKNDFPLISILREKPACFFVSVSLSSGHFVPKSGLGREAGFLYTLCLLMKPVLRLRLHATQSQPCFPTASNLRQQNRLNILHFYKKPCFQWPYYKGAQQPGAAPPPPVAKHWWLIFNLYCYQQTLFRGLRVVSCKLT